MSPSQQRIAVPTAERRESYSAPNKQNLIYIKDWPIQDKLWHSGNSWWRRYVFCLAGAFSGLDDF